jgi:hypothetical protein
MSRLRHVTDKTRRVERIVLICVVSNCTVSKYIVFIRVLNTVCLNISKILKIQKIQKKYQNYKQKFKIVESVYIF